MKEASAVHHTFEMERNYPVSVERLFAAFSEPQRKRLWYADSGTHDVEEFEMDFRANGVERSRYRMGQNTPFPGVPLTNEGLFLDIAPGSRIVLATGMMLGDRRISVSLCTFEFESVDSGSKLIFTHQGVFFEGSGGPEMRLHGWEVLLGRLEARLREGE